MDSSEKVTQEKFEALLFWLSPDRNEAGKIYEKIRQSLIRFFYFKACASPEDLADETINRVIGRINSLDLSNGNKPTTIFHGFANKVFLEYYKKENRETSLDEAENLKTEDNNRSFEDLNALDKCLKCLPVSDQRLVVDYYLGEKSEKSEFRRILAEKYQLTMGAMHIKLHRLRQNLRNCIEKGHKNKKNVRNNSFSPLIEKGINEDAQ